MARILQGPKPLTRNASATAAELIREAIVEGRLDPGQRLKEADLARDLGISRTPIREALLMLEAMGLVEMAPNRGAIVHTYTADDLDDLYQLRAMLEGYVARRAAGRISKAEVERLRQSCDRFDLLRGDKDHLRRLVKENLFFHDLILEVAGSARLSAMVRKVVDLPLVYKSYIWYSPDQKQISAHYHRQIVTALAARDSERAELIMKEHMFEARDLLVEHMRELEGAS